MELVLPGCRRGMVMDRGSELEQGYVASLQPEKESWTPTARSLSWASIPLWQWRFGEAEQFVGIELSRHHAVQIPNGSLPATAKRVAPMMCHKTTGFPRYPRRPEVLDSSRRTNRRRPEAERRSVWLRTGLLV